MPQPVTDRLRGLFDTVYREVLKFGIIGALAFVIDLGLANLLWSTVLEGKVTTAKIISGLVATAFAWWGNRSWTFAHRTNRPVHHEAALFFLVNLIALGIGAATLAFAYYVLGHTGPVAKNVSTIIGIGLGTLFRFWCYRAFVFGEEAVAEDTSPLAEHHH
ncbi:MAG: GtrA family protein [Micrococcales bacterium]|nr:GtrA family protein [Micrococcales bacterium]